MKHYYFFFLFLMTFFLNAQERVIEYMEKSDKIYRNNTQLALSYLHKGEILLKDSPNDSLLAAVEMRIGSVYYLKGDYGESVHYYSKSLAGFKKVNDRLNIGRCYNGLGLIQQGIDRHRQAIVYFQSYLSYIDQDPSAAYLNLGISYLDLNEIDKAEYYFKESYKYGSNSSIIGMRLAPRNRLAQIQYLKHNFKDAISQYDEVIEMVEDDNWELSFALAGLAETYIEINDLNKALLCAKKSYQAAKKVDALWDLERITALLAQIHELNYDYKKAYNFSVENRRLKDSLFNKEQSQIIAVMQLDKKEADNETLTLENQIVENNLFVNQMLTILIVIVLMITLFFVFKFRKIIKEKEQLNLALAQKNVQLTKIDKGKNKLFSIVSHDLRSPIASLTQIMDLLLQNAFSEKEKEEVYSSMRTQLDNTSRMLNNLLIWASTQLNGTKVNFTEIELITEMTEILNVYKISSQTKGISIKHNINQEPLTIKVDKVQLHVILHNLLSNGLKYTAKEKNISVSYKVTEKEIELHIFNEGKPISLDKIDYILGQNVPVTSLKGTDGEFGTGLGLYLIKKYVQLNQAKFSIQPIEEKGTLVILSFKKST